ncbi:Na+/H+ antiporter subunit D [Ensifer soli]|uniref:Na+/H+ antiporter subunit D n=1 Tax=Ciceribacter sp. sgz301302 TaxID=3342379 RepID=UPI0035BB2C36
MAAPVSSLLDQVYVAGPTGASDWLAVLPPAWCLSIGALLVMLRGRAALQAPLSIAGLALLVVIDIMLLGKVAADGPLTMMMGRWLPPFGIAFTVDLTGALFALAAGFVGLVMAVSATRDIAPGPVRHGFYPMLLLLMAGVSGAFVTGDIFNLYVWFEVMLIASFGLISIGGERRQVDGAVKYGFLNLVATTLFLLAIAFLYGTFGTLNMADLAVKAAAAPVTAPRMTIMALFLFAFAMKAAAFPLQAWLPASYHTPPITVSALFAALMTKVGIYAMLRVGGMLFPAEREGLSFALALVGAATMLAGALGALAMADLRRIFGFLVISGVGAMIAGIAVAGPGGIGGTIVYALHSIVVMAGLYLVAGLAGKLAGGFNLGGVAGLYRADGRFAALSLMLFLSVSGLPPFSGFWPKVMILKAALDIGAWWLSATLLVAGLLTTIATLRLFLLAWWRPAADGTVLPRATRRDLAPVAILAFASLLAGIYPEPLLKAAQDAAAGLAAPEAYVGSVFGAGETP